MVISKKRIGLLIAVFCFALATAASGQQHQRTPSTAHSLIVNSNLDKATVLRGGFFLGNTGQSVDVGPGYHELIVASPGYIPRAVRVLIAATKETMITVNLIKVPTKRSINADDFEGAWKFQAKRSVVDLKSLCTFVKPAALPSSSRFADRCERQSWLDDIEFAGHQWLRRPDLDQLEPLQQRQAEVLLASQSQAATDDWYRDAENLFGLSPGNTLAYSLLAKSSLMRGDCGRVYMLMHEHGMHGVLGMPLRALAAHCMELEGRDEQAISLLKQARDDGFPEAGYHLARIRFTSKGTLGEEELGLCVESAPTYLPCAETLALWHLKSGRPRLAQRVFDVYDKAVKAIVQSFYQGPFQNPASLSYEEKIRAIKEALKSAPFSYTLNWELLLALNEHKPIEPKDFRLYVDQVHLSDLKSARRLIKRIRALGKTEYLEDLYWQFTENYPRNPIYWLRLAEIKKRKRGCGAALEVVERAIAQNLKSIRGIYTLKGDCLITLGKYAQAEEIFRTLIKDDPDNWKPFWNMGIVMEERGDRAKSLYFYREALVREPPEQHSVQLLRKIDYMERFKADAD